MFGDREGVEVRIQIPPGTERRLRKTLNEIDPKLRRHLSAELRSGLASTAQKVADRAAANASYGGTNAPMSGMIPRWGNLGAKVKTYPAGRPGKAIATISVFGDDNAFNRLLAITERAGSVTRGLTPQGRTMTRVLQDRQPLVGRGGRFIWKAWLKFRPEAVAIAIQSIEKFVATYNKGQ
jgi:hypothetical protein